MSRPTLLNLFAERCGFAVSLAEQNAPMNRDVFQPGIAAHEILQACGNKTNEKGRILSYEEMQTVARAVCERLIAEGRSFDGNPEPPLHPNDAWAGRDIALDYLALRPLEPGAEYEVGVAVGSAWEPMPYEGAEVEVPLGEHYATREMALDAGDPSLEGQCVEIEYGSELHPPHFRSILDVIRIGEGDGEQEFEQQTLVIRDYKSAWPTDAERLNHLQQRCQAVLAVAHYPDAAVLRREVVNLRTRMVYSDDMYLGFPETDEILDEWRADVDSTLAALEEQKMQGIDGMRAASPGACCVSCPYVAQCDEGREYLLSADGISEYGSLEEKARLYAVTVAMMGHVRDTLKAAGGEPIEIEDGRVGYIRQAYREPLPGAYRALMAEWGVTDERAAGMLHAMKPTKANLENALKVLFPEDPEYRADWLREQTREVGQKVFKVVKHV